MAHVVIGNHAAIVGRKGRWKKKLGAAPTAPGTSHPTVVRFATGEVDKNSVIRALANSSFDAATGAIVAVGVSAVIAILKVCNAQGPPCITGKQSGHLTNQNVWETRMTPHDCKRAQTAAQRDDKHACDACLCFVHSPRVYADAYRLCADCHKRHTALAPDRLVPIALVLNAHCFAGSARALSMLRAVAAVTKAALIGLLLGAQGGRCARVGTSAIVAPLGCLRNTTTITAKRSLVGNLRFWIALFPENDTLAVAMHALASRMTKKSNGHNLLILGITSQTAAITSRGRATHRAGVVSRAPVGGDRSVFATPPLVGTARIDTRSTLYVAYRVPGPATLIASVGLLGCVAALDTGVLTINVHLRPERSTHLPPVLRGAHRTVDPDTSRGHTADVRSQRIVFDGETVTWEHIWRAHHQLGARHVDVVGSLRAAVAADRQTRTLSWKAGGAFWELATMPHTTGVTVLNDFMSFDQHPDHATQDAARAEGEAPPQPRFLDACEWEALRERASRLQFV